jgi:hypothetical protein
VDLMPVPWDPAGRGIDMSSIENNITTESIGSAEMIPEPAGDFTMIAEFRDVDSVMHAAENIRDAGYLVWDVHSPFPIHGISRAMGLRPTMLPWIALVHGIFGLLLGLGLVWWTNATTVPNVPAALQGYEYLVSGKPRFSLVANIPIIFETTILFTAFGTVLGMLGLNKLPMLANPLLRSRRFRRVTRDGLFVVIESQDKHFRPAETQRFLRQLGATWIEFVAHD